MATTAQQVLTTTTTGRSAEHRTVPRALIVAIVALVALTIALVTWQLARTTNAMAPAEVVPEAVADPWAAYQPGGSVYEQQVPKAAAEHWAAYRPGGSVYEQQVPEAGR